MRKKEKIILYAVFAFYALILWLVLIDRGLLLYLLSDGRLFPDCRTPERLYNDLRPLRFAWVHFQHVGMRGFINADFLGNVLMFVPVGIFTCTFTKGKYPYRYIYIIPLLSIGVELTQFVLRTGILDADDVILNTLGGAVGVCIFAVIYRLKNKDMIRVKRVVTVMSSLLVPYLLIFFYKMLMSSEQIGLKWYDLIPVLVYYVLLMFSFKEYSKKHKIAISSIYALCFAVFFSFIIYL